MLFGSWKNVYAFNLFFFSQVLANSLDYVERCFCKLINSPAPLFLHFYQNNLRSLFSMSFLYTRCSNQRWNLDISCMVDLVVNNTNNLDVLSMWMGRRTSSGLLLMDTVTVLSQNVMCPILAWGSQMHWYDIFVTCSYCSGNIIH